MSNYAVVVFLVIKSPQSHVALMWVQSVKLTSQSVFIADLQNVEVKLGSIVEGYPCRFSAWMGFCQMRLFTSLWIMKRMRSLYEEIDTMEAVAWIFKF